MRHTPREYAEALYEVTRGKRGSDLRAALRRFLTHLSADGTLSLSGDIICAFEEVCRERKGMISAAVSSARSAPKAKIRRALGATTETVFRKDPALIGGIVLERDGIRVDASIARRLRDLRAAWR